MKILVARDSSSQMTRDTSIESNSQRKPIAIEPRNTQHKKNGIISKTSCRDRRMTMHDRLGSGAGRVGGVHGARGVFNISKITTDYREVIRQRATNVCANELLSLCYVFVLSLAVPHEALWGISWAVVENGA